MSLPSAGAALCYLTAAVILEGVMNLKDSFELFDRYLGSPFLSGFLDFRQHLFRDA